MSVSVYRRTAASIVAAAVFETFPQVQILGTGETRVGFFCDLIFPHLVHSETLAMIEQAMRQISREKREIRTMEMVPLSARELFKAKGHRIRAEQIQQRGLVQIVQIGSFYDFSEGAYLGNTEALASFKLDQIKILSDREIRIAGFASATKEELKDFLKILKEYKHKRHEAAGQAMGLWRIEQEGVVWLKLGLKIWDRLIRFFDRTILDGVEFVSLPQKFSRMTLIQQLGRPIAERPLQPPTLWDTETGLLGLEGPNIEIFALDSTSLLHLTEKSLNILGLKHKEGFFAPDALGKEWQLVTKRKVPDGMVLSVSIVKILALLLESSELMELFLIENQ